MEIIKKILAQDGEVSAMRIMAFISLTAGIIIAILGLLHGSDLSELSVLSGVFVGAAFGGKAMQKFAEKE